LVHDDAVVLPGIFSDASIDVRGLRGRAARRVRRDRSFWYRDGDPQRLAIWFQGGGGCWKTELCDPKGTPTFDGSIAADDDPAKSVGLFDPAHEDSPIATWSVLFVPYCTADVHIGNRIVQYRRPDGTSFSFAHVGARNTHAALDWLKARLAAPLEVLVSGESAGAIAAAFWASEIGDRFPSAELVAIGDAAGGYRTTKVNALLEQWGALDALPDTPAYRDKSKIYFETFYVAAAEKHPKARLAQVNFADDAVQRRFMDLLGAPVDQLTKGLTCNLNEVRLDAPGFHSFIYPGTQHVLLRTPAVWTTSCAGAKVIDWVRRVIAGEPVETTWCENVATELSRVPLPRL
jgi:Pectinacetylesterase